MTKEVNTLTKKVNTLTKEVDTITKLFSKMQIKIFHLQLMYEGRYAYCSVIVDKKMLENRPDDALGSLVETVETVQTVETEETVEALKDCRDCRDCGDFRD